MERYKTLNNWIARDIIRQACAGNYRSVYMLIYNCHNAFEPDVFHRLCKIVVEFAPLTIDIYKSLPYEVQAYYSAAYANLIANKD